MTLPRIDTVLAPALRAAPVVAILRDADPGAALDVAALAVAAGVRCLEVTIETDRGRRALAAVVSAYASSAVVVGAGTVRSREDARTAVSLGAAFTVSPGLDTGVLASAAESGIPHLPGVATPSEALAAIAGGATWLKAFPASVLGSGWLRAMAGPFPEVRFVATGGIGAHNAAEYLGAGAIGVGVSLTGDARAVLARLAEAGILGGAGPAEGG